MNSRDGRLNLVIGLVLLGCADVASTGETQKADSLWK
jgi:hypothetical protein